MSIEPTLRTGPAAAVPPKSAPTRAHRRWHGARPAAFVLLLAFMLVFLIPVYVLVVTSFKPLAEADPSTAWSLPRHWSLEGWKQAWTSLRPGLENSVRIAVTGSLLSAVLGSMNGFVLSKWRFPGADAVFTALLFGMFIPYQAVMIPLAGLMGDLRLTGQDVPLLGTTLPLIVAHTVYGIPICTLIFRNYYITIPTELIEAARVAVS